MSLGISAESKNKRGHSAIDVCMDDECKKLLRDSTLENYDFVADRNFDFNDTKYLCMKRKKFVGKPNRII